MHFTHNLAVRIQHEQLILELFWWLCDALWGSSVFVVGERKSPEVRRKRQRKIKKERERERAMHRECEKEKAESGVV